MFAACCPFDGTICGKIRDGLAITAGQHAGLHAAATKAGQVQLLMTVAIFHLVAFHDSERCWLLSAENVSPPITMLLLPNLVSPLV